MAEKADMKSKKSKIPKKLQEQELSAEVGLNMCS